MKKKLKDLTRFDIEDYIWEIVVEDVVGEGSTEDLVEFAVRSDQTALPDSDYYYQPDYIGGCKFFLADGTVLDGFISPRPDIDLECMCPTIFFDDHQLPFQSFGNLYHNMATLAFLGKRESEFFPVTIMSMIPYDGTFLELTFEGFP